MDDFEKYMNMRETLLEEKRNIIENIGQAVWEARYSMETKLTMELRKVDNELMILEEIIKQIVKERK